MALEHLIAYLPVEPDLVPVGNVNMGIDDVRVVHACRSDNGKRVLPSEPVLLFRRIGDLAALVCPDLAGYEQKA